MTDLITFEQFVAGLGLVAFIIFILGAIVGASVAAEIIKRSRG